MKDNGVPREVSDRVAKTTEKTSREAAAVPSPKASSPETAAVPSPSKQKTTTGADAGKVNRDDPRWKSLYAQALKKYGGLGEGRIFARKDADEAFLKGVDVTPATPKAKDVAPPNQVTPVTIEADKTKKQVSTGGGNNVQINNNTAQASAKGGSALNSGNIGDVLAIMSSVDPESMHMFA